MILLSVLSAYRLLPTNNRTLTESSLIGRSYKAADLGQPNSQQRSAIRPTRVGYGICRYVNQRNSRYLAYSPSSFKRHASLQLTRLKARAAIAFSQNKLTYNNLHPKLKAERRNIKLFFQPYLPEIRRLFTPCIFFAEARCL